MVRLLFLYCPYNIEGSASRGAPVDLMRQKEPALPPPAWTHAIDATYSLFELEQHRRQYGSLSEQVRKAVQLCEEVVKEIGVEQCALSFNGGKDCTVLIHILAAVLRRLGKCPQQASSSTTKVEEVLPSIPSLYITCTSPFQEVEDFVADSIIRYNMKIVRLGGDMKQGLERYLEGEGSEMTARGGEKQAAAASNGTQTAKRQVKAIFIGTRRTDPHGAKLTARNHTDDDWPYVERIQPILDWSYQDVWAFLRCPLFAVADGEQNKISEGVRWGESYGIPYCVLYDEGYTSLGSTFNTHPNPVLDTRKGEPVHAEGEKTKGRWKPAYMLEDGSLERAGRQAKQAPKE